MTDQLLRSVVPFIDACHPGTATTAEAAKLAACGGTPLGDLADPVRRGELVDRLAESIVRDWPSARLGKLARRLPGPRCGHSRDARSDRAGRTDAGDRWVEVCRNLRAAGNDVPIVFLTARDSTEDRISGLTKGGDDYLTKPFSLEELVARIRAVLRRTGTTSPTSHRLSYADLELDEDTMRVARAGQPIKLSPTEFKLLRYLLLNPERVLFKTQILDHVWEYDFDGNASVVENYISYLRKKVDITDPPLIHTVRGFGYVLRTEP